MDNYSKMLIESSLNTISYYEKVDELYEGKSPSEMLGFRKAERPGKETLSDVASRSLFGNTYGGKTPTEVLGYKRRGAGEGEKEESDSEKMNRKIRERMMKKRQEEEEAKKGEVKEDYFIEMLSILEEAGYLESEEDFLGLAEAAMELHDYYLTEGLTGERYHKARKMISDIKMPPGYKRNRRTYTNDEMQKINKLERLSGLGISNQGTTRDKMPHRGGKFGLDTGKGNKAKRRAGENVPEYDYGDKD